MRIRRKILQGKKWLVLATIIMLVSSLALAGCGTTKDNTSTPAATKDTPKDTPKATEAPKPAEEVKHEPVAISWVCNAEPNDPFITSTIAAFQKMNPWITVNYVKAENNDMLAKMVAMQAAGTPADAVCQSDLIGGFKDKLYEDLTPYFSTSLKDFHIKPELIDSYKVDGKFYGVPYGNAPFYIFVNKDLLTKYGMQMPSNDWTYDQMRDMMKKATNATDGTWGMDGPSIWLGAAYSAANGSSPYVWFLNNDKTQSVAGTPEVIKDMQWLKDLVEKDKVIPTGKMKADKGIKDAFGEGKALFQVNGIWMVRFNKDLKFGWDVLPLPHGKVNNATAHYPAPMIMASASKHKDAALTFLSFFGTVEMGKINIDSGGVSWIVNDELDKYLTSSSVYAGKNAAGIAVGAASPCCVLPGINTPGFSDYDKDVQAAYGQVMDGGKDIAQLFVPIADKFNKNIADVRAKLGLK